MSKHRNEDILQRRTTYSPDVEIEINKYELAVIKSNKKGHKTIKLENEPPLFYTEPIFKPKKQDPL